LAGEIYFNNLTGKFDWGSVIEQLIRVKSLPLQGLSKESQQIQVKQSAISKLLQAVSGFSSHFENLDTEKLLKGKRVNISNNEVAMGVASEEALNVSLRMRVLQLAEKEVMLSNFGTQDLNANITWNNFTLRYAKDYGDFELFSVQAGSGTLSDLVNSINQSAGSRIQASIYFDGENYRILFMEKDEALSRLETDPTTNTFVISEASAMNINGVWGINYPSPIQLAKNAKITVGDSTEEIISASNTFENIVTGVNITVKKLGEATISVEDDSSGLLNFFKGFVDKYNALVSVVNQLTAKDALFQGDYTVVGIKTDLSRMMDDLFRYDLVNVKEDGTLELNSSAVSPLLRSEPSKMKEIIEKLKDTMGSYLSRTYTTLQSFDRDYQTRLESINARAEALREQLIREEERLKLEYAKVEAFINRAQEVMVRLQSFIVSLSEMQGGKRS
jgi:flagellar hook-associated protein 2